MNDFFITLSRLGTCLLLAILGGCVNNALTPFSAPASSESRAASLKYHILYSFHGRDGAEPIASLIDVDGTLYGTTAEGGTHNAGTVFSITRNGKENVLHNFGATASDGTYPSAALIDVNGTLYGTTAIGNANNTGTVFSITTSGKERIVYSFQEFSPSGMEPSASLIEVSGGLYGTTNVGGRYGVGTVFAIDASGKERTLHSFGHPYPSDGQIPAAALSEVNGTLYGTTYQGGTYGRGNSCSGPCPGYGTVFGIGTDGTEQVLHSFGNGTDGINPQSLLTRVKDTLYGTTMHGGSAPSVAGTIFSIDTAGVENLLYSFKGGSDGAVPAAGLIYVRGKFYGTTEGGGAYGVYGTVFSINTNGTGEIVVHSFGAAKDGRHPEAALLNVNGTLYGTTSSGGTYGKGTVFVLTP